MNKDVILCACNSADHQMLIFYDDEYHEVYLEVHLSSKSFFKRLVCGIKYIFGYTSRYGHWDEFILNVDDKDKFQKLVDCLSNNK